MKKELIKNYLIMMLGGLVIGVGVAFVVYAKLGGDAMTTFEEGISVFFNMELPIAQAIANAIFIVILFFIDRKRVNIDTVLCPLFITLGCKLAINFIFTPSALLVRYLYMIVGVIIVGAGIGIGAQTPSGSNPYDGTIMAISDKINKSFSIVRPICDAGLFVVGFLLHGSWGVGTIVATFATGYIANVFIKLFSKIVK